MLDGAGMDPPVAYEKVRKGGPNVVAPWSVTAKLKGTVANFLPEEFRMTDPT
jgi:hypothetical protein